jgi:hypothetical protein
MAISRALAGTETPLTNTEGVAATPRAVAIAVTYGGHRTPALPRDRVAELFRARREHRWPPAAIAPNRDPMRHRVVKRADVGGNEAKLEQGYRKPEARPGG